MKKIIKKTWGIGLIVVLLASMLLSAAPALAGDWAFGADIFQPTAPPAGTVLSSPGFDFYDVAQNGDTIYAVGQDTATTDYIYKSVDGGATWAPAAGAAGIGAGVYEIVAVAPDNANVVVVVDTNPAIDVVYLSTNGGVTFSALGTLPAGTALNTVAIAPENAGQRIIAVGGNDGAGAAVLEYWTVGPVSPLWAVPAGFVPATPLPAPANAGVATLDDIMDIEFSSNFLADQAMLVVISTDAGAGPVAGEVALHIYSFNTTAWDATVDVTFPRVLEYEAGPTTMTCASADIELDPTYFLADAALQTGFVAANIVSAGATNIGGVYVTGTYTVAAGPIYNANQIFTGDTLSVAWDGTNLVAGSTAAASVWRSANALTPVPSFIVNSTIKAPGSGTDTLVLWSGADVLAFSQGQNSGVAKSTDNGRSFNGIALLDTDFAAIYDTWVSPDASVTYLVVDDSTGAGGDVNIWRKDGTTYQRIAILAGENGSPWLVQSIADDSSIVYLGKAGAKNMYYSTDSGDTSWTVRSSAQNIKDFVVQDQNTLYVAVNLAATVIKSANGGFTWSPPVPALVAGACNDITLIGDDELLLGGTTGAVSYSTDGNTSWNMFAPTSTFLGGNTVVAATGLGDGDTIFATSDAAGSTVNKYTIGTSVVFIAGAILDATNPAAAPMTGTGDGIIYSNGVLYVLEGTTGNVYRFLSPTITVAAATDFLTAAATLVPGVAANALQVSEADTTTTLWAISTTGTTMSFSDYLTSPVNAPSAVYPMTGDKIPVNSISGGVSDFVFRWSSPPVSPALLTTYDYDVQVYLDEAGTILVATQPAALAGGSAAPTLSLASAGVGVGGFNPVPGETYYWRVRTAAGVPAQSAWSEMQSFTIQQTTAIVPVISSPENGSVVSNVSPGFSWSPISGATSYQFEVSTNAAFTTTLYSSEVPSAGAQLPVTIELEPGTQYFWRVKTLAPAEGEWSTVSNFMVEEAVEPTATTPQITITTQPAPTITITQPGETTITMTPPEQDDTLSSAMLWVIIIIGAILVIAVIVLIVRTRRSV